MTIWTKDNTPNGVWVPPEHRGNVSLFFRFNPPSKLSPGQLLLIENHAGGIGRNLAHWGYDPGALASRRQTVEEHNHAALCGRHTACYYQSWQKLIDDELQILAEFPAIGGHFVDRLRELSRLREYKLHPVPEKLPDETEPDSLKPADLTPAETEVARETASQLGMSQLELFT